MALVCLILLNGCVNITGGGLEDNIKRYSSYGDKLLKQSAGDPNFKKPTPIETIIKKTGTLRGKAEAIKSKMDASRMFTSRIPGGAAVLAPADFVLSMVAGVPIYDAAASAGSYLLKDPYLGKAVNIPLALRAMTDYGDADEMLQKAQERKEKIESTTFPLDETVSIMRVMDNLRKQWGLRYPNEKQPVDL